MNVAHVDLVAIDVLMGDVLELCQPFGPLLRVQVGAFQFAFDGVISVPVQIRNRPAQVPDAEVCSGPVLFCGNFVDVPEIELGNCPCVVCRDNSLYPQRPASAGLRAVARR